MCAWSVVYMVRSCLFCPPRSGNCTRDVGARCALSSMELCNAKKSRASCHTTCIVLALTRLAGKLREAVIPYYLLAWHVCIYVWQCLCWCESKRTRARANGAVALGLQTRMWQHLPLHVCGFSSLKEWKLALALFKRPISVGEPSLTHSFPHTPCMKGLRPYWPKYLGP